MKMAASSSAMMPGMVKDSAEVYERKLVRIGIITTGMGIVANFIPAIYLWLAEGIMLDIGMILTIWALAFATFGVSWIVQPISFFPALGVSGSYTTWLAGSGSDIRLPSANMARKAAGVDDSTPAGDVMSSIGVSCSIFVSVSVISIFTFIGAKVIPMLPIFITKAFAYIMPAIFGAIFVDLTIKNSNFAP